MNNNNKETPTTNNSDLEPTIITSEGKDDNKGLGLVDGIRIYKRRKRRKIVSNSDEFINKTTKFHFQIEAVDGSASDQDLRRLSFDAFANGPGECSLRHCSKIGLQQMHESLNGHENGGCIQNALVTYPESGCSSVLKESVDRVERSDDNTHNYSKEPPHRQSEGSTISELCGCVLSNILNSDKYSELSGLLLKNFGVTNIKQVLDLNAINFKMNNGAYETSPMLYLKDIQQVWIKLQQVGNEMVTLAKSLADTSRAHFEQFVRKPRTAEASACQGCGKKADARNCLVCDSCEEIYHLSCTELVGTEIPPKSWYCVSCVSIGIGSPHDNCTVCEKLKAAASVSHVDGVLTNGQSQHVPNGLEEDMHDSIDESQSSKTCFICKSEVKIGENYRTCGHSLCEHKFYHYRCLTYKQLGVIGPCWYCPSCLCRRCLVDKDDDQIVLCDGCDQAYHIYCASPQLNSIPKGSWFCGKCDRELKRIQTMKRVYENLQKKVKIEDRTETAENKVVSVVDECEEISKSGGLEMLVTAAKTLSHQETMDTLGVMR